jgi:NAD(P)-dependent dehydrogenase (short-subunit alcohol dehydrogenase family)
MGKYDGKTAVITGGTSGLGLATAELLLDAGARVMVTGHTAATLDAAREKLEAGGSRGEVIVVQSDAASLPDIDALADRVKSDFGSPDMLFVNAGVTRFARFEETPEAAYDEVFAVNAKGPYFSVQRLAPLMTAGSGVVLTTSVANVKGLPMVSAYAASKAALRSMTRSLASELLPRGIRVNAVSPGPIDTGILGKALSPEAAEAAEADMRERNPMKRFGRPEEIARAVAFLAFDATFTTGAELAVDGGASQL